MSYARRGYWVRSLLTLLPLVTGLSWLGSSPAQADVVIINGRLSIEVGQPTPSRFYPDYRYATPVPQIYTDEIENSTLINPIIIGAPIEDSTLINPVIVPGYGTTVIRPGYGTLRSGQDNPACMTFRSLRPACQ
jgi:hypothetical protein